jgi:hypothetical protein
MRTTIDLEDRLFRRAKIAAIAQGVSLKKFIEQGVDLALKAEVTPRKRKRIKFPIFPSKTKKKIHLPADAAHRAELAEDIERYAASS